MSFPVWAIIIIVVVIFICLVGLAVGLWRFKKNKSQNAAAVNSSNDWSHSINFEEEKPWSNKFGGKRRRKK